MRGYCTVKKGQSREWTQERTCPVDRPENFPELETLESKIPECKVQKITA